MLNIQITNTNNEILFIIIYVTYYIEHKKNFLHDIYR